jgi:hypothetical protein
MPAPVSGPRQIDEDYGEEPGKAVRIPINDFEEVAAAWLEFADPT